MTGIELIAEERRRQIEELGFTAEHDANHSAAELAMAAACYALHFAKEYSLYRLHEIWPFEASAWKPGTDKKRLGAKAGAMMAAALDRLDHEEGKGAA